MKVSVIVPVYNAERYVRQAVESALAQPETGEVILIEDCSPDNSLRECERLVKEFSPRVKLLRHSDGGNHGAGASRNVGIRNATYDFVAFLDADDYYLPERFSVSKEIMKTDLQVDGVYEAVGVCFQNANAEQRWRDHRLPLLTTMPERVPPESLFELQQPVGRYPHAHTNGWTIRKAIFGKSGLFDRHLRLHQDTVMFARFAAVGKMLPGRLDEPVAMRRVHDQNRKLAPRPAAEEYDHRILMWAALWEWGRSNLSKSHQKLLLRRFIYYAAKPYAGKDGWSSRRAQASRQLIQLVYKYPRLLSGVDFWEILLAMTLRRQPS